MLYCTIRFNCVQQHCKCLHYMNVKLKLNSTNEKSEITWLTKTVSPSRWIGCGNFQSQNQTETHYFFSMWNNTYHHFFCLCFLQTKQVTAKPKVTASTNKTALTHTASILYKTRSCAGVSKCESVLNRVRKCIFTIKLSILRS